MAAALGIGRFAYTPLLPEMVAQYGWAFAAAGDVASANFLGYTLGALLAPKLMAGNVRLAIALSFMASVATTYIGAEVDSYVGWLVIRFAAGVASAFCLVIVTTHLIYTLADSRAEHMGNVHFAGVGMGILLCMGAVQMGGDVAAQWARLGALSAVLMALAWFLLPRQPLDAAPPGVNTSTAAAQSASRTLWLLITGYGFFGFGYVVSATFVVAMAKQLSVDASLAGSVWWVVGAAMVPSVYLWQAAAQRFGLFSALRTAYLLEALGVALAGVGETLWVLYVACVLLGGTFAAVTALGISAARISAPNRVAYAVSAMTVAFALGQLLGPAVAGRMADVLGGFMWPSLLAAALLVAAAILVRVPSSPSAS